MADITPRKRSRIITLSGKQTAIANCKRYARKTRLDLQKNLIHAGVHISSSIVRRHLLEAGRNIKKPLKAASYSKLKTKN